MAQRPSFNDLRNQRVLITGASTGIGAAVAVGFGACGAHVGVHYHRNAEAAKTVAAEIEASGGRATLLQADLADPASHAILAQQAVKGLGGIDVLINNAGQIFERRAIEKIDDAYYLRLFDLNVRAVVGLTNQSLPALAESGHGAIITTTSIAARTGGAQGTSLYAATKGALESLTIGLAKELGPKGIRVNAVAPSMIVTPLHDGITSPETLERVRAQVPLGRLGEPEDCVGAFLFLASSRLAGYVSGITIGITGGRV